VAVTITQLTAFLAVVRTGSVTAAADELVVTQPSVSAALAALTREVGVDLTERSGRNLRLTAAGEAFAPYAAEVLGLLEQGRDAAREAGLRAARRLRIAAVTTAGEYVVPPLLRAFAERHPDVTVSLDVGNRHRVFDHVRDHRVDIGIGGRPPVDGGLTGTPFLRNEIVLITGPDDPLATRRSVPVDELGRRTWLLREEGSGTRALVEDFLAHHDLEPPTLTLGSNGAIKSAARFGLGVSLQSRLAVELELRSGELATLAVRGLPTREWYALRAAGPLRPPVEDFLSFVATPAARAALTS
jgi:DNA-binding transcriptional LysR family regulator